MNEYDDSQPLQQPEAEIPTWQEIQQTPEFQNSKPEDRLVAFSRWHDAAYNAAQQAPDWNQNKDEFNRQAAQTQKELSNAAGGIDPDMARLKVAMDHVKEQEGTLGRPLTDDEKSAAVQSLGPDVAKVYQTPPSVIQRLYRPVAAFGEGFASGLGQTLQTLGYFASQPGSMVTKLENKLFGTPTQEEVMKKYTGDEHPLEWLGKRLQTVATTPEAESALDPRTKGGISEAVGHTAGGLLEFLGESALGGAELKAAGFVGKAGSLLSKEAAGKLAAMSVFGIHNAAEGINHARDLGVSEDQVLNSALAYGAVGATTAAITPFQKWLGEFDKATGGGLTNTLKKAVTEGGQFAAQMFTQQFGNNAVNKAVLAENTDLLKDTFEQAKSGGATGIVASLVLAALLHGKTAFTKPSTKVTETTETSTGKVTVTADKEALDRVNKIAQTSPQTAAAVQEIVTGEKPVQGRVIEEQQTVPAEMQDLATGAAGEPEAMTPQQKAYSDKVDHFWQWGRANNPEQVQAIHDAAGRGDFAERDKLYDDLRNQWRNSDESNAVGVNATLEQQAQPVIKDLADGKTTPEDFADQIDRLVAEEAQHQQELPKVGKQPRLNLTPEQQAKLDEQVKRETGLKGVRPAAEPNKVYTEAELDQIVADINRRRKEEESASRGGPGLATEDLPRFETFESLTPEELDKLRRAQPSSKIPTKVKKSLSELGYTDEEIDKLTPQLASTAIVNAQQGTGEVGKFTREKKRAPAITAEGGITPTKSRADLIQEYSKAKAEEDARVSGAKLVSPGKAIGRSPAEIEREIIVNDVKDQRAKAQAANKPFNVREAVIKAKTNFENQFNIGEFNPFKEPGIGETEQQKAAQKAQVQVFRDAMIEQLKTATTPEEKADIATEFLRKVQQVEGRLFQERTKQAEFYVAPPTEEFKQSIEKRITDRVLSTGVLPADSRALSVGIGPARAKKLFESLQKQLSEAYPPEPKPTGPDAKVYEKNQWVVPRKGQKGPEGQRLKTQLAVEGKSLVTGDVTPVVISRVKTDRVDARGKPIYEYSQRPLFTNDPKITAIQLGRIGGEDHLYIPTDLVEKEQINPAIHIKQAANGRYYVDNVDTFLGNIGEPGSKTPEGRIAEQNEFEKLYEQKISRFQKAATPVRPGTEAAFEAVARQNAQAGEEGLTAPVAGEELLGREEATGPTGTLADIWPVERRGSEGDVSSLEGSEDTSSGMERYSETENLPTDAQLHEYNFTGELPDDAVGKIASDPTSSAVDVGFHRENEVMLDKLGLRDTKTPVLNAIRAIASLRDIPAEQRQLAKDLLANDKIDLSKIKANIGDLKKDGFAAAYSKDNIYLDPAQRHEGGIVTSVLHEVGHHVMDAKLQPEYKRNAVEERVYQQRQKLFDYAKENLQGQDLYALTNPEEFFTTVFSRDNPTREALSKIAPMKGYQNSGQGRFANFLDQVINAIKSFITGKAVNKGSLYDQVLNEVMGLTREGELNPERLIPRLAAETAAEEQRKGVRSPAQEDINGALQQMNRAELEQAARDHGYHNDEINSMLNDELRVALGMSREGMDYGLADTIGSGSGGWLGKDGEFVPAVFEQGHMLAAQAKMNEFGIPVDSPEWESPYQAMRDRGYARIVNDYHTIHVDGPVTDKQRNMILEEAKANGKTVTQSSLNPPYKSKVIYSPNQVFVRAGTNQQPASPPPGQPYTSFYKGQGDVVTRYDTANNIAAERGREVRIKVGYDFGGDTKKNSLGFRVKPTEEMMKDRTAAPFVREALGDKNDILVAMDRIQNSTKIDDSVKNEYLPILQHAYDNFDRLTVAVNKGFAAAMKEQLERLQAVGVDVKELDGYVTRLLDRPDVQKAGLFAGNIAKTSGPRYFLKSRQFEKLYDAIAENFLPKSEGRGHPTDILELAQRYVDMSERLVQMKNMEDALRTQLATDGKPIIGDAEEVTAATTGKKFTRDPVGYKTVSTGGRPMVVHQDYVPLFQALYGDSTFPKFLKTIIGQVKLNTLLFDSYHVGRIMFKTLFYGRGAGRIGYNKGLGLLEYQPADYARALQTGEMTQKMVDYANEKIVGNYSRRDIANMLIESGANFGRVADNLYAEHASAFLPGIKNFNSWVFQKLSRGAMAQTAVENFARNMERFPERGVEGNLRQTAKEYNEVFGNLQNQSIFKNKFYQDAVRALLLAPQWAESQLFAEGRGIAQLGKAGVDLAKGKARLGTVAQGQLSIVLGMLAANQVINYATRGHSTFENKEDGHKLDAFIPSLTGKSRGFFFNPLEIGAEYSHMAMKYYAQHQTPVDILAQIGKNKLGPIARGITEGLSGRDYAGRKIQSTTDRFVTALTDALPLPIGASGVVERDPRVRGPIPGFRLTRVPDAGEKQIFQSFGLKLAAKYSPRAEIFALAYPFRNDKSYTDNAGEYTQMRQALDTNNLDAAKDEIRLLVSRGHTERQLKAAVGMSPTGSVAPETFTGSKNKEADFRKSLTPDQLELYRQAQKDHIENAKTFLKIFKEVRPDLVEALRANDKARK